VFTGLTGSDVIDHVISADVKEEDINRALEKWLYYMELQEQSGAGGQEDEDEEGDDIDENSPERHFDNKKEGSVEHERSNEDELWCLDARLANGHELSWILENQIYKL